MSYAVELSKRAARELADLPREFIPRLDREILSLAEDPRPPGCKKLKGKFAEGYRIRVGEYGIHYLIDDPANNVCTYRIGNRRVIYE